RRLRAGAAGRGRARLPAARPRRRAADERDSLRVPRRGGGVPVRVGESARGRGARGSGRRRVPDEGRAAGGDRRRDQAGRPAMRLDAENTAIVLDSTADFPEAPERFTSWRVVPLYVRFGDESYRDYVGLG